MKNKIIYVDFIKKRRVSHIYFFINNLKKHLFNKLSSNNASDDIMVNENNVRHMVNKLY